MELALPLVCRGTNRQYTARQWWIYAVYTTHYVLIDFNTGIAVCAVYSVPVLLAANKTRRSLIQVEGEECEFFMRLLLVCYGFLIVVSMLAVRSLVAGSLCTPEDLVNTSLYSVYFSLSHILEH